MKLTLGRRAVLDLVPYATNSKNHGDTDIEAIAASITRFGFNDPIGITPDGVIVEGHGRWLAAQQLGMDTVPVILIEGLNEDEFDLYRIAHNKIALTSTFNFSSLFDTLQGLVGARENGIAFADMGFSDSIVDNLFCHFAPAEQRIEEGGAADSTPIEYDVVWDSKEDKARFTLFMAEEVKNGADKAMGGEVLMAAIRREDPDLYAELMREVPGDIPLDHIAGRASDEEQAHVTVQ